MKTRTQTRINHPKARLGVGSDEEDAKGRNVRLLAFENEECFNPPDLQPLMGSDADDGKSREVTSGFAGSGPLLALRVAAPCRKELIQNHPYLNRQKMGTLSQRSDPTTGGLRVANPRGINGFGIG